MAKKEQNIEELINDLEIDEDVATIVEADEEDINAALASVEAEEIKQESYKKQGKKAAKSVEKTAAKSEKKADGDTVTKAPRTPAFENAVSALESAIAAGAIEDGDGSLLARVGSAAKKQGEKVINAVQALTSGKRLSIYTQVALTQLKEHGAISATGLKNAYMATEKSNGSGEHYGVGTASSQSQQLFHVLQMLGVTDATGKKVESKQTNSLISMVS